jgi:hypothetical protein
LPSKSQLSSSKPGWSTCHQSHSPIHQLSQSFRQNLKFSVENTDLRVERGIKHFARQRHVFVFGQNAVDWLLSFSHRDWATIYVAQPSRLTSFDSKVFRRMGVIISPSISWLAHSKSCDVLLGAGDGTDLAFILNHLESTVPALIVCSSRASGSRQLRNLPSWPLHHSVAGGTTLCKGRLWTRGLMGHPLLDGKGDWSLPGRPSMDNFQSEPSSAFASAP